MERLVDQEGRIYFDSNREGGSGNYDIWVAEGWEGPVTNVTELNSAAPEREIAIDGDLAVSLLIVEKEAWAATTCGSPHSSSRNRITDCRRQMPEEGGETALSCYRLIMLLRSLHILRLDKRQSP